MAVEARLGVETKDFSFLDESLAELAVLEPKKGTRKKIETNPATIKAYLDEHVVGQEEAKKIISVAYYNHLKRTMGGKNRFGKSNILMVGSTGSGKTLIAEKLAEVVNVPFVIEDATRFTKTGYVGEDVETMVKNLYTKAGRDKKLTEHGIIYIDECDKLASGEHGFSSENYIGGKAVQNGLLKLMEGTEVYVDGVVIDTKNILFICGGAFSDMDAIVERDRQEKRSIGFGANAEGWEDHALKAADFIKYGLTPEFVSRLPVIVQLSTLTENELVKVLTEPKNAICEEYKNIFLADGATLRYEPAALQYIAKTATKDKTGARGLRGILESSLMNAMFVLHEKTIERASLRYNSVFDKIYLDVKKRKSKGKAKAQGANLATKDSS